MSAPYHSGELAVQEQAGGRQMAQMVGRGIRPFLFDYVVYALPEQNLFVASVADDDGNLWALPLAGENVFARAVDAYTMAIDTPLNPNNPLHHALQPGRAIGLLGIVLQNRIRIRINGIIESVTPEGITVHVQQAYGNCPKYIQKRRLIAVREAAPETITTFTHLSAEQQTWIAVADTFFVATSHPDAGADASHRGGNPGFVQINGDTLTWPDYAGNMMFNTLGNIIANPNTGLLFIDFERDRVLQLTGQAEVLYDDPRQSDFAGAQR
ncbi:MAG: pyridoxamine 5'-phosphate oxidase family protein, partial [Chloroflexota bacterium]